MQSKVTRNMEDTIRLEGPPKSQQFWEKSVSEILRFEKKEEADKFEKLVEDLKLNVGKY